MLQEKLAKKVQELLGKEARRKAREDTKIHHGQSKKPSSAKRKLEMGGENIFTAGHSKPKKKQEKKIFHKRKHFVVDVVNHLMIGCSVDSVFNGGMRHAQIIMVLDHIYVIIE